jgi:hypothetical protein
MAQMKKTAAKPAAPKASAKKVVDKKSLAQDITNRYSVTAREARDIVTAVISGAKAIVTPSGSFGGAPKKPATLVRVAGDIAKQAGETYTAATKGKPGTSAGKLKTMIRGDSGLPADVQYYEGTKRKKGSKK